MSYAKRVAKEHRPTLMDFSLWTEHAWLHCSCSGRTYSLPDFVEHIALETRKLVVAETTKDGVR